MFSTRTFPRFSNHGFTFLSNTQDSTLSGASTLNNQDPQKEFYLEDPQKEFYLEAGSVLKTPLPGSTLETFGVPNQSVVLLCMLLDEVSSADQKLIKRYII